MLVHRLLNAVFQGAKKKDKRSIVWTEEAEKAFQTYKNSLTDAALLAHPKINSPLILITDASDVACGAALQQKVNGLWESITFFSKKFLPQEIKYNTYDRELTTVFKTNISNIYWKDETSRYKRTTNL